MLYVKGNVERIAGNAVDAYKLESEGFKLVKPPAKEATPAVPAQQEIEAVKQRVRNRKKEGMTSGGTEAGNS